MVASRPSVWAFSSNWSTNKPRSISDETLRGGACGRPPTGLGAPSPVLLKTRDGIGIDISLGALSFEEGIIDRSTVFDFGAGLGIRTCQLRELLHDRRLMRMFGADQDAMPLPPTASGWFHQDHHLAAEEVDGQSAKHPLREKARMALEDLKDPFIVERSH
jgi:hypothetical protein